MAVLNKIRQQSLVLIIVIALALFAFIFTGLFTGDSGLSGGSQDVVATINGVDVKRGEFALQVENRQRQIGANSSSIQTMNFVWNQELRKIILKTEYDKLGLTVEKDQMEVLLKTSFASFPEFLNEDGLFDEYKMNEFIANLKAVNPQRVPLGNFQFNYNDWVNTEKNIAVSAKEQAYYNMIKAGVGTTLAEAEAEYLSEAQTVDIKFMYVPYSSINDSLVEVTKSDITNYINNNKDKYKVDATRDINFVQFIEVATLKDEEAIKADVLKLLNDRERLNKTSGNIETFHGLLNTKNIEEFVNSNSDIKYDDRFLTKKELPQSYADSLLTLNVNEVSEVYKDAGYYKMTKIIADKTLPDSVKVRHILISHLGASSARPDVTRTEEEAKKTADSVMAIVKANPTKFPDLVTALSSDAGSVSNGGEYDYHGMNKMVKPFNDFEFENNIGDIEVVKTVFGFHIIEILGQKNQVRVIQTATIARKIEPSEETGNDVFNTTSKFEIALQDGDFQELAKKSDLTVRPVNNIKDLDENIPGLNNQRKIVKWAFNEDTKTGDYKRFSVPGGYAVVQLSGINKEGLMTTDNASASALPEIKKEKKAKLIRAKISASTVDEVAKNQSQISRTASAINMKNPTLAGAGIEPLVIGTAFGLKEGETSKLIDGNKGVYLVEVAKINEATKMDNYFSILNRLKSARKNAVQTSVFNALKEAADIEDNRATIY